jgi:hypothetical protein
LEIREGRRLRLNALGYKQLESKCTRTFDFFYFPRESRDKHFLLFLTPPAIHSFLTSIKGLLDLVTSLYLYPSVSTVN